MHISVASPRPRRGLRPLLVMVASVIAVSGVAAFGQHTRSHGQGPSYMLDLSFNDFQPWWPSGFEQLQQCKPRDFSCVAQVLQSDGAPAEQIAYFRLRGKFLTEIVGSGVVKVGSELDPWAANSNLQQIIIGGSPAILTPELDGSVSAAIEADPAFTGLLGQYPNLGVWGYDQQFESETVAPQGGQRLIFLWGLNNGCHACGTPYVARVAFDFAPDGSYLEQSYLNITTRQR